MTWGTELKCSSMKVNGLIQVRENTSMLLIESGLKASSKVVKRHGSIRMTRGME